MTVIATGQNYEIVRKTNICKVIKEWTEEIPEKMINTYNLEFTASEQNECGNLILTISFLSHSDERLNNKIMNIVLARKTTNNESISCMFATIYESAYSNSEVIIDGNTISHYKSGRNIEITKLAENKYRIKTLTLISNDKSIVYTYQFK
jgi:hypothetical protein